MARKFLEKKPLGRASRWREGLILYGYGIQRSPVDGRRRSCERLEFVRWNPLLPEERSRGQKVQRNDCCNQAWLLKKEPTQ